LKEKGFNVTGFDVNKKRITELSKGYDSTNEYSKHEVQASHINFSSNPTTLTKADFIIVAVPTPINKEKDPDLYYIESACCVVGKNMSKGTVVIFESTVYPGVTEEVCIPILEKESGFTCPEDFKVGYSPERINPGDKVHTIDKIMKIVSGIDKKTLNAVAD